MTKVAEIWKEIPGFPTYEVSDTGKFRNKKRNKPVIENEKWGLYKRVKLSRNNNRFYFSSHRIVAMTFIPNPDNKPIVCHKDNNKYNNCADNLYWGTHKENTQQARRDGLFPDRAGIPMPNIQGEKHTNSSFTNLQVSVIKEAIAAGHSLTKIARYFKSTKGTIWKIKAGYSWRCV